MGSIAERMEELIYVLLYLCTMMESVVNKFYTKKPVLKILNLFLISSIIKKPVPKILNSNIVCNPTVALNIQPTSHCTFSFSCSSFSIQINMRNKSVYTKTCSI